MATATARGIIVRVSVYSSFAILDVALDVDVDDAERSAALPKGGAHSIFAVKFSPSDTPAAAAAADGAGILPPSRTVVRSVGRDCKVGDLIEAIGVWLPPEELKAGSPPRFHITCVSVRCTNGCVHSCTRAFTHRVCKMLTCTALILNAHVNERFFTR